MERTLRDFKIVDYARGTDRGLGFARLPKTSVELIEDLARLYSPKCLGRGEDLHDHLRFAGKVELVNELLQMLEMERAVSE